MNRLSCQSGRRVPEAFGAKEKVLTQSPGAKPGQLRAGNVRTQNGVESDVDEEESSSSDASSGSLDIEDDNSTSSSEATPTDSSEASSSDDDSEGRSDGSRPSRSKKAGLDFGDNSNIGHSLRAQQLTEWAIRHASGNDGVIKSPNRSFPEDEGDEEQADRHIFTAGSAKAKQAKSPPSILKRPRGLNGEATYVQTEASHSSSEGSRSRQKKVKRGDLDSIRSRRDAVKPFTLGSQRGVEVQRPYRSHKKAAVSPVRDSAVKQNSSLREPSYKDFEEQSPCDGSSSTSESDDPNKDLTQAKRKTRHPASLSPSPQSSRSKSLSHFPSDTSTINPFLPRRSDTKHSSSSDLRQRLTSFLPQLKNANAALPSSSTAQLDKVDDGEERYIEMDLGLGVLEDGKDQGKSVDGIKIKETSESESENNSTESDGEDDEQTNKRNVMDTLMRRKAIPHEKPVVQEVVD
ncbi:MAG: hypothetical protein Q9160_003413 [Pyrenula sp. 1 TL-2023]